MGFTHMVRKYREKERERERVRGNWSDMNSDNLRETTNVCWRSDRLRALSDSMLALCLLAYMEKGGEKTILGTAHDS